MDRNDKIDAAANITNFIGAATYHMVDDENEDVLEFCNDFVTTLNTVIEKITHGEEPSLEECKRLRDPIDAMVGYYSSVRDMLNAYIDQLENSN